MLTSPGGAATPQQPPGCTVAGYAAAKRLPEPWLRSLGLADVSYLGAPAVRIPYRAADTTEVAVRFRVSLTGDDRYRWRRGDKPVLYGLERLGTARDRGYVVLVEGESDCHTLWLHGEPALGVPGAGVWREERDAPHLDGFPRIYVVVEPDRGGEMLLRRLATSRLRDAIFIVRLGEHKDVSALYLADPAAFPERWQAALAAAEPLARVLVRQAQERRLALAQQAAALAREPDILARFVVDLERSGLVGEARAAKLLYLAVTSRLLDRPVSLAVKGPSSAGKSFLVERVLRFFPPSAFYALSAMSERALVYSEEPLAHRVLVLFEAAGLTGEFAAYAVRTLLSEGRLRYEVVEKTRDGLRPRLIERAGPTGLILTTTAVKLHPENETRLLSLTVTDDAEQTRAVLLQEAEEPAEGVDFAPWHALQEWLAAGERRVHIPYARTLAAMIPPVATRLRRDFRVVLTLIRAHALLHQANRDLDAEGRIVATLQDYAAVRDLVADLVAEGVGTKVPPTVRETVGTVAKLIAEGRPSVSLGEVARALGVDKSTASRRVHQALDLGALRNLEPGRGRASRLVLGDPLPPEDGEVLPTVERLQAARVGAECCGVARTTGEGSVPPFPLTDDVEVVEV